MTKTMDSLYIFIAIVVNIVAAYAAYVAAPTEVQMGDVYRIFYIHTPSAWVCYLSLGVSLVAGLLYLRSRNYLYDTLAEVSAALGLVYGGVALVTGSIWANAAWGTYWNWDPRQTTTLILWMAYLGYLAFRLSVANRERRASLSAVYGVLAFSTVPLSYLSIRFWVSLHPLIVTGGSISITLPMVETLLLNLVASSLVYIYLLRMFYSVRSAEERVELLTSKEESEQIDS